MAKSEGRPHILLVGGDGGRSGVPRHICHLTKALMPQADVTIISDANTGGYDAALALGAQHQVVSGLAARLNVFQILIAWIALIKTLRATAADVIWLHARLPVFLGRLALACRFWRPQTPVVITHHGLPFGAGRRPLNRLVSLTFEYVLLRCSPAHHIVVLTHDMREDMKRAMGTAILAKHHVHVLGNCSDLGDLSAQPDRNNRNIVMTGRAGWQKNYALAVKLLRHLPADTTLTLCGGGTENARFQNAMRRLVPGDVSKRLLFAGPIADVRAYLANADAYMLTSRYEGVPIGALEAFEAGLPIILKNFDGANELVKLHPCAVMDDFSDLKATAAQITALMDRYAAHREMLGRQTQRVWQAHWSFDQFAANAQTLIGRITP